MKRFLVVGDANVDIILSGITGLPDLGQEQEASELCILLGGSCANSAVGLSVLGASVSFWGKVGSDPFGDFVVEKLAECGIDTNHLIIDAEKPTGTCIVLSHPRERALVTHAGTIATLTLADLPLHLLSDFDHLHTGSVFLQHQLRPHLVELLTAAKEAGLTTSLDCGWDPAGTWSLDLASFLSLVDVFLPNEGEALQLTQAPTVEDALRHLSRIGNLIVVKRGAAGAVGCSGEDTRYVSVENVEDAEPTGAGDCFNAGFLYAMFQEGNAWPSALDFAAACGRVGASMPGGSSVDMAKSAFQQLKENSLTCGI